MINKTNELTEIKSEHNIAESIKQDLKDIAEKAKAISEKALEIKNQGGWDAFWSKSENIKSLAGFISDMTLMHQREVDILILIFSGLGHVEIDYNEIIETIDVLSKEESDVQTLKYLLDLKRSIKLINEQKNFILDRLDSLDEEIKKNSGRMEDVFNANNNNMRTIDVKIGKDTNFKRKWTITTIIFSILFGVILIYEIIKIIV